ncbi:MAG TPA: hypothetical protein VMW52_09300 [Phycisphaerae bacterium]|nr:hypothetical protein [Phycisphaerae bacterium]
MPWSAADMKAKGAHDGAKAAAIANAVLERCRSRGGPDAGRCEELAIRIALAKTNKGKKP